MSNFLSFEVVGGRRIRVLCAVAERRHRWQNPAMTIVDLPLLQILLLKSVKLKNFNNLK